MILSLAGGRPFHTLTGVLSQNLCSSAPSLSSSLLHCGLLASFALFYYHHPTPSQLAFRPALVHQQDAGMRLAIIPHDVFPAGRDFFDHPYVHGYTRTYHPETLIVHNNWIKGHKDKLKRFKEYHLWGVNHVDFPQCLG